MNIEKELPKDHKEETHEMYLSDSEVYSIDEIIAHLSKIKESGSNNISLNIMTHGEAHFTGTDKESTDTTVLI